MNVEALLSLSKIRGLSQAELARKAGVSRQAISAWIQRADKSGNVNIYSKTQDRLAKALRVKSEFLNTALPEVNTTAFLWDRLFPNIETFVLALVKNDLNALARLVQVHGLYASSKMLGKKVWQLFPNYKNKIHPAYRKQLEVIWKLEQNLA